MTKSNSYVYFTFRGDNFDMDIITTELGITPTDSWKIGDPAKYVKQQRYSCWKLQSKSNELLDMDKLVNDVVSQLLEKIELINNLKQRLNLETVLSIVMYIDINEEKSTPFLGHNSEVIGFLHRTKTTTDVDIYRYNSGEDE